MTAERTPSSPPEPEDNPLIVNAIEYPEDPAALKEILQNTMAAANRKSAEDIASGQTRLTVETDGTIVEQTSGLFPTEVRTHPDGRQTLDGMTVREYIAYHANEGAKANAARLMHGEINPQQEQLMHPAALAQLALVREVNNIQQPPHSPNQ
jgi:hypothetical protein